MRSAAAAPQGPATALEPRRRAAARWPGRHSLSRTARRGGRGGGASPGAYPSAAPPPPGPGPPPSAQRSPPSASNCFGSNGNSGGASRPGSRQLLGLGGPPRPFVVLLLPLASPAAPPSALLRASPLGTRASLPRSGVSSVRRAPGCPRPACEPVYGPLTMSLKPQQQQQPPAAASVRKPGGGLLTSPVAAPSPASVSSSSAAASSSSSAAGAAGAGGGRPGLGRWVSAPQPPPLRAWTSRGLGSPPPRPTPPSPPRDGLAEGWAGVPARVRTSGWAGRRGAVGFRWDCQAVSSLLHATSPPPSPNGQDGGTGQPPPLHLSVCEGFMGFSNCQPLFHLL